jgi:hypothetical protein
VTRSFYLALANRPQRPPERRLTAAARVAARRSFVAHSRVRHRALAGRDLATPVPTGLETRCTRDGVDVDDVRVYGIGSPAGGERRHRRPRPARVPVPALARRHLLQPSAGPRSSTPARVRIAVSSCRAPASASRSAACPATTWRSSGIRRSRACTPRSSEPARAGRSSTAGSPAPAATSTTPACSAGNAYATAISFAS